jgi:hypothetical protein
MVLRGAVYPLHWMRLMVCCAVAVKRLGVSVRKFKALTVKMDTVTLIGNVNRI